MDFQNKLMSLQREAKCRVREAEIKGAEDILALVRKELSKHNFKRHKITYETNYGLHINDIPFMNTTLYYRSDSYMCELLCAIEDMMYMMPEGYQSVFDQSILTGESNAEIQTQKSSSHHQRD